MGIEIHYNIDREIERKSHLYSGFKQSSHNSDRIGVKVIDN